MKIKYKSPYRINLIQKGDWIDLRAAKAYHIKKDGFAMIDLGIAMELPAGFEAIVAPRSSTFKSFGLLMVNGIGVIDNSYRGNNDIWKFPVIATIDSEVEKYDRVAQFRIQPSQRATIFQKIRWMFSRKIEFVRVDELGGDNRGGFGSTGIQ